MRTKLRSRIALLFVAVAALVAVPVAAALADEIVNDVVASSDSKTITKGKNTTVKYWIVQQGGDGQTGGACNASDGSPVTLTINKPAAVTVSGASPSSNQLQFSACGEANAKSLTFTSSTVGSHTIPDVSYADTGTGAYDPSTTNFTLHVGPFVSSTEPTSDQENVPVDTTIRAFFSDAMDVNSINSNTFKVVKDGSSTPVTG
jgi:hypothetical protein